MQTSLRYSDDAKSLALHAKQKIVVDSETFLQVRAELDTKYGGRSYVSAMLRRFYNPPLLVASLGLGVQFDKCEMLGYVVRGKMGFPVTSDESVRFNVKGHCDVDNDLKQVSYTGLAHKMEYFSLQVSLKHYSGVLDAGVHSISRINERPTFYSVERKSKGAAEFSWSVLNFQKDQDVRVKVGYDIIDKVPYLQIRENNWTVNADAKGRWNVRYDL